MRDNIKFKVWDFITRKFDDQIYNVGEQFGHPSSCDWVACQYTGFKDKNDKEVFEYDIVKYYDHCEEREHIGIITFSTYETHSWGLSILQGQEDDIFEQLYHRVDDHVFIEEYNIEMIFRGKCNYVEVIGNVFENFELLDK
jgi:uncharacterized phage protein (TIGR01671 family)